MDARFTRRVFPVNGTPLPAARQHMPAAVFGIVPPQAGVSSAIKLYESGRAINTGRCVGEEIVLRQFRAHLVKHAVDAPFVELDHGFGASGLVVDRAIVFMHDLSRRVLVYLLPVRIGVTPELTLIKDNVAEFLFRSSATRSAISTSEPMPSKGA